MELLSPNTILQVDATIITGILILLTLAQMKTPSGILSMGRLTRYVATVVIPFSISAIIVLFNACECLFVGQFWLNISMYVMIGGFVQIISVIFFLFPEKVNQN